MISISAFEKSIGLKIVYPSFEEIRAISSPN
jgi:hypothetical protein